MSTPYTTPDDIIKAAASVARDVAEGALSPAALEAEAVSDCRSLFATVVGEGDPLWPLQCEVARGVLAAGGIGVHELQEWLSVAKRATATD
ncbi:flagellar hook-length control protein [Mycobacterium sp.]|uniref:flagellar hook-length control protein n=1 Tax=Mycobacterium sp. TaxID=1785 RepID=UPI003F9DE78E